MGWLSFASVARATLEATGRDGKPFTRSSDLAYRRWQAAGHQGGAGKGAMTNTIALYLALVILAALGLDILLNEGRALVFLMQKLVGFIEYVEFWH
jgi:hypothetical protein